MRSVSIVYKKPRRQVIHQNLIDNIRIRRSVDQYYNKLHQKSLKKHNQEERTHTSNLQRKKLHPTFKSSFNIIKLQNKNTSPIHTKHTQNESFNPKIFASKKTLSNFFSFKLPSHNNYIQDHQFRQLNVNKGCKLRSLCQLQKNKEKQTIVVLSVDFILNQMNFWEEQAIQQGSVRVWKTIQNIANIIWLVRRQSSLSKIKAYIRQNNLNSDGVYLVVPKKNGKTLSVSYSILQNQLKLQHNNKLIIINGLRVQNIQKIHFSLFYSIIPQVKHSQTFIHFVKVDVNEPNRFNSVLKVLSKKLPKPININTIFKQFYENQNDKFYQLKKQKKCNKKQINQQFMLERIQILKKNYCNYLSRVIGLRKVEGQQSIPFIVGDMLKRNFQTLTLFYKNSCHNQQNNKDSVQIIEKLRQSFLQKNKAQDKHKIYYNRPVYIWKQ